MPQGELSRTGRAASGGRTGRLRVQTPTGEAWIDLDVVESARAVLVLGHGAGGTVDAPDLLAVTRAALAGGISVARVTQPYRVLGRRAPAPAPRLDEAWLAVTEHLARVAPLQDLPAIHAGRSSGARVACRCAAAAGAAGVIALAFPVHPPGRPERTRAAELEAVACPLLVVQGASDAFGQPPAELFDGTRRILVSVRATHALGTDTAALTAAVAQFLERF